MIHDKSGFVVDSIHLLVMNVFGLTQSSPRNALIHFESDRWLNPIHHELDSIALFIFVFVTFWLLRFFPLEGWGGPKKDRVLRHCLVHGLAIISHLVQVLLQGTFPGLGSGLIGCGMVFMVRDPIMVQEVVPSRSFVSLFLALQVCAHGMSGSSVLSEESWLGSTGCGLLTSNGSVVHFSSIHWLFLADPSCFSAAFFHLAYCLLPTLCSLSGHHMLDRTE